MKAIIYVEGKSSHPFQEQIEGEISLVNILDVNSLPNAVFDEVEVIDGLEFSDEEDVLDRIIQKVRHGGALKIRGTDALQVFNNASTGSCSLEEATKLMLGGRQKLTSAHQLKDKIVARGLDVSLVGIVGYKYIVEAHRK